MARGVFRVYQEPAFVPVLTVRENMVLGLERRFVRRGLLSGRQVHAAVSAALEPLEGLVDLNSPISACDRNTQQAIEILRALLASRVLGTSHPIILLDEPTASLVGHDLTILFDTLERLRGAASFVFVSHRLSEINDHCDRAYVLKDGKLTSEVAAGTSEAELHRLMVGRERSEDYYLEGEQGGPGAERLLVVDELTGDGFHEVSLAVNAGEIVGIAGVVGSGKEQLGRAIAGLAKTKRGRVIVTGKDGTERLPAPGHVGYVPSDRQAEGAMELFSVARNISMSSLAEPPLRRGPFVSRAREREVARQWVQRLSIRTSSVDTPMGDLSGGNQQKVVLSRVLQTGVRVLVLDNPARGIDAGAKADLYRLLRTLAAEGHGIVLIADELPEVIGLSSRVLVMKDGRVRRSFDADPHDKPLEPTLISEMV
jgi:ribose transport system ATP-binding protein